MFKSLTKSFIKCTIVLQRRDWRTTSKVAWRWTLTLSLLCGNLLAIFHLEDTYTLLWLQTHASLWIFSLPLSCICSPFLSPRPRLNLSIVLNYLCTFIGLLANAHTILSKKVQYSTSAHNLKFIMQITKPMKPYI